MYNLQIIINYDFVSISVQQDLFEILQKSFLLDLFKNSISLWVFCTQCFSPNARSTMTRQFLNQRRHLWSGLAKDSRGVGIHGQMGPLAPVPPKLCHVTNKPFKYFFMNGPTQSSNVPTPSKRSETEPCVVQEDVTKPQQKNCKNLSCSQT